MIFDIFVQKIYKGAFWALRSLKNAKSVQMRFEHFEPFKLGTSLCYT